MDQQGLIIGQPQRIVPDAVLYDPRGWIRQPVFYTYRPQVPMAHRFAGEKDRASLRGPDRIAGFALSGRQLRDPA